MITTNPSVQSTSAGIPACAEMLVSPDVTALLPVLRRFRPNILIVAADVEADWALEQIRPGLRSPVVAWSSIETPNFDAIEFGTLLVRQIDSLTTRQQTSLDALLGRTAGELQIVGVASRPLFPLVTQGKFPDDLYYRLNTVLLDGFEWSTGRIPRLELSGKTPNSESECLDCVTGKLLTNKSTVSPSSGSLR